VTTHHPPWQLSNLPQGICNPAFADMMQFDDIDLSIELAFVWRCFSFYSGIGVGTFVHSDQ
jgi:hypothetical protein